jgi:hypothetical protein
MSRERSLLSESCFLSGPAEGTSEDSLPAKRRKLSRSTPAPTAVSLKHVSWCICKLFAKTVALERDHYRCVLTGATVLEVAHIYTIPSLRP